MPPSIMEAWQIMAVSKTLAQVLIYPLGLLGIAAVSRLDSPFLILGALALFAAMILWKEVSKWRA